MNNKAKKQKRAIPKISILRPLLVLLFVGFVFFVIGKKTFFWVKHSPYFRIKRITCSAPSRAKALEKYLYLKNQSIFDVDIVLLQKKLEWSFPEIGEIRIVKRFPDEIRILLRERPPYAAVALGQDRFLIDRQGFIVSKNVPAQGTLPLIMGLSSASRSVMLGQRITSDQLQVALTLLDLFNAHKALRPFIIVKMNVSNLSKISFYLGEQLEVVIDKDDMNSKIDTLAVILEKAKLDWERIRYVDLRFQEPVIKYDQ